MSKDVAATEDRGEGGERKSCGTGEERGRGQELDEVRNQQDLNAKDSQVSGRGWTSQSSPSLDR